MLTKDDVREIGKLLNPISKVLVEHSKKFDEQSKVLSDHTKKLDRQNVRLNKVAVRLIKIDKKLATNTASVVRIENEIGKALELRLDVSQMREQVRDHEERTVDVERFPKTI